MFYLPSFFFFHVTPTTDISPLSLHDALPISEDLPAGERDDATAAATGDATRDLAVVLGGDPERSEEHTSELQSHSDLVCRLLLEKKKKKKKNNKEKTRTHHETV